LPGSRTAKLYIQKNGEDEFYTIAFHKQMYRSLEEPRTDLGRWLVTYNSERAHSGKYCFGKTPLQLRMPPLRRAPCAALPRIRQISIARASVLSGMAIGRRNASETRLLDAVAAL
jgi:hypothetical protein